MHLWCLELGQLYFVVPPPTLSLTHSLTHLLTHSLTHSHSLSLSLTPPLSLSLSLFLSPSSQLLQIPLRSWTETFNSPPGVGRRPLIQLREPT